MASRRFYQGMYHAQPGTYSPVKLWLKVTCPADYDDGTITINKGSELVSSVADGGTGIMTITLKDTYKSVLGFNASILDNSGAFYQPEMTSEDVDGAKTITVTFHQTSDGAATDPDGATVYFDITLEN